MQDRARFVLLLGGLIIFLGGVGLAFSGCGPGGRGSGDGDGDSSDGDGVPGQDGGPGAPDSLRVEPADLELAVEMGLPTTQAYQAIYTDADGDDHDVTGEAVFSLSDSAFGSFTGATFSASGARAGTVKVRAMARGKQAETNLTLRLRTIVIGPGADASSPGKFGGAVDAARAPTLVYPNDGTLVPPNLNELEWHYLPGTGNTLFRLTLAGELLQVEIYFTCAALGAGCSYAPDEDTWELIAQAERGRAPVVTTLAGVDGAAPGSIGVSAERTLAFGQDDIVGGLYYWNAGAGMIMRYDFGLRSQVAEKYLDQPKAQAGICVGCHQLSRDGTRIAFGVDFPSSTYRVYDVADRTPFFSQGSQFAGGAGFFTFNPDATQILVSNGNMIGWRDATSGAAIMETLVAGGGMPDWSPDGAKMVYAKPSMPLCQAGGFCPPSTGVAAAGLEIMPFDGATFGASTTLVPYEGQNNYYPAFAPSGEWIMFNRAAGESYDAPDATVWVVGANGGAPVQLAHASIGGDSWPKWAPDVQPYRGGELMWFTFSSRRPVGLRPGGAEPPAQIWMAAFDPAKAAAGEDGSFTAFWLPFQEAGSGNHIAQWVTEVVREDCMNDSECETGEFCEGGMCLPGVD